MDLKEKCEMQAKQWKKWADAGVFQNLRRDDSEKYNRYRQICCKRFMPLYWKMSDEEILNLLYERAAELGRNPTQKEVFPAYHIFIRKRFKNWPTALRAAGLKPPKEKRI